jgi:hypothetical protein
MLMPAGELGVGFMMNNEMKLPPNEELEKKRREEKKAHSEQQLAKLIQIFPLFNFQLF